MPQVMRGEMRLVFVALAIVAGVACHGGASAGRRFAIVDSTSGDGGTRRPGGCARVIADRASGTRLTLRGWDERTETHRTGSVTTPTESFQHGFYAPVDARAVGLSPGQEYEVDCRTFVAVGINTPDVRPTS